MHQLELMHVHAQWTYIIYVATKPEPIILLILLIILSEILILFYLRNFNAIT